MKRFSAWALSLASLVGGPVSALGSVSLLRPEPSGARPERGRVLEKSGASPTSIRQ